MITPNLFMKDGERERRRFLITGRLLTLSSVKRLIAEIAGCNNVARLCHVIPRLL